MLCPKPIGIRVLQAASPDIPKDEGNAFPGRCTRIGEALASGKTFYTVADQCFCTGGTGAACLPPTCCLCFECRDACPCDDVIRCARREKSGRDR